MLHELIFVLLGYPGDIFIPHPPPEATTFAIPTEFPLLHPTERECLNRLGQLGWIYLQIHQFIIQTKNLKRKQEGPHGAYVQALAASLELTLNDYRNDILAMEQRILNKEDEAGAGVVPLSLLVANLNRWELLLPCLWSFVQRLMNDPIRYHGCRLFDLLLDQSRTGLFAFRTEIEKMLIQLHNVLYRQLTSWMVYGQLVDPDGEFFIVPYSADQTTSAWNRLYVVDYDRVPSHLSRTLVESILFVGKAIATVNQMDQMPVSISRHEDDAVSPFRTVRSRPQHQQQRIVISSDMRKKHLDLLLTLHSSSMEQHNHLSAWVQYPQQLQYVVNQVRKSTTDWLFTSVLSGENGVHHYLSSFRNIFLLCYGEFATNFIQECVGWRQHSLQGRSRHQKSTHTKTISKTAATFRYQEINALLNKASVNTEAEDQLAGFRLLIEEEDNLKQYPFSDLLFDARVILTFDLEWPIDLFLNKADLKNYSHLWSFFISLKSTQLSLNKLWMLLRVNGHDEASSKYSVKEGNEGYYERCVWRLRSSMSFWIDTIWNHFQSFVIDSHYRRLIETTTLPTILTNIKRKSWNTKTKIDFEEIQMAHELFLNNIMRGCLLKSGECTEIMHSILVTCLDFCGLMEKLSEEGEWRKHKRRKTADEKVSEIVNRWTKTEEALTWMDDVEKIQEKFNLLVERFFILASSQQPEVKSSGQIDILLMQLDYNEWYSKKPQYTQ